MNLSKFRNTYGICLVFVTASLLLQARDLKFEEHLISNDYTYAYAVAAADLDGDGDLDLTSSDCGTKGSRIHNDFYWYENDGSGKFRRHSIASEDWQGRYERHRLADINQDGRVDLVGIDNFYGDVFWFENPGNPAQTKSWKRHAITSGGLMGAYDVDVADLDGDGRPDVAASSWRLGNNFTWYRNPGPWQHEEWPAHIVDEGRFETRTIRAGDFNGDGLMDLVGSARVAGMVLWYENSGNPAAGPWRRHVISLRHLPMHGTPVDLDRDGDLDMIMAGGLQGGDAPDRHYLVWYENAGEPGRGHRWRMHNIQEGFWSGFEGVAHDLDKDGDLDVVATGFGQKGQIAWFENSGDPTAPWKKHPLKEHWKLGATVIVADMDGDEWSDVVAVNERGLELRWWHNRGPR